MSRETGTPVQRRDDLGDLLLGDLFFEHRALRLELGEPLLALGDLPLELGDATVADLRRALQVAVARGALLVGARFVELGLELL